MVAPGPELQDLRSSTYEEMFTVDESHATFTVGLSTIDGVAPRTLIGPARAPGGLVNFGDVPLEQVDLQLSPRFITEWL